MCRATNRATSRPVWVDVFLCINGREVVADVSFGWIMCFCLFMGVAFDYIYYWLLIDSTRGACDSHKRWVNHRPTPHRNPTPARHMHIHTHTHAPPCPSKTPKTAADSSPWTAGTARCASSILRRQPYWCLFYYCVCVVGGGGLMSRMVQPCLCCCFLCVCRGGDRLMKSDACWSDGSGALHTRHSV